MRKIHKFRTFIINEKHYEFNNNDCFNCFRHVTRETKLQQIKNLQYIILNNQFDNNAKNNNNKMILMTYFKNSIRIQKIDRVNYLTKIYEQTIFTLNVCQNDRIF